jgi:hypothetical protein
MLGHVKLMSSAFERIPPAQAGEAREVAVGGANHRSMLDRECRQVSVSDQIATGLGLNDQRPEQIPMTLSGV